MNVFQSFYIFIFLSHDLKMFHIFSLKDNWISAISLLHLIIMLQLLPLQPPPPPPPSLQLPVRIFIWGIPPLHSNEIRICVVYSIIHSFIYSVKVSYTSLEENQVTDFINAQIEYIRIFCCKLASFRQILSSIFSSKYRPVNIGL